MVREWLMRLFGIPQPADAELFNGDADGVICERGLSEIALQHLRTPTEEWFDAHAGQIGVALPRDIRSRLPAEFKEKKLCWYFRADLDTRILLGDAAIWKAARIEEREPGVWAVYFV